MFDHTFIGLGQEGGGAMSFSGTLGYGWLYSPVFYMDKDLFRKSIRALTH